MARIVLFGNGLSARLAHFYLGHDSEHEVVGFSVERSHVSAPTLNGLPVVAFDEVAERFPPASHRMFVTVGYARMNKFREERFHAAKELGYELISYVSSRASIWPDTEIGENCFIMEDVTLQPFVRIGADVTLWSAAHVGAGSRIGDHAFVSSQAVLTRDVTVEANCFIGVNATIDPSVVVARETVVGAGAHIEETTREREVFAAPKGRRLVITSDRLPAV